MAPILLFPIHVFNYFRSKATSFSILINIILMMILILFTSGQVQAEFHSLPLFPDQDSSDLEELINPILEAYREEDYVLARTKTKKLLNKNQDPLVVETAMFLAADLEYEIALIKKGSSLSRALASYQEVISAYPSSENAIRAYWKMGEIYREMQFYYESIASHRRILNSYPGSQFGPLAQRGIARTYKDWGKLIQAAWEYRNTVRLDLPPSEKPITRIEYADVLFLLGRFEGSYRFFQEGMDLSPRLAREHPSALFRYGEAAFWTNRFPEARVLFTKFFNLYPKEPLHLVALVRVGDSWRKEQNLTEADHIYHEVHTMESKDQDWQIADLVLMTGEYPIIGCCPPAPLELFPPKRLPQVEINNIRDRALASLTDETISPSLHRILLESGMLLKNHGYLFSSIQIFSRLYKSDPAPLVRKRLATLLQETTAEAVTQHAESEDNSKIVELYFDYPIGFSDRMLKGPTGLNLANSFSSIGLYRQAIDLYLPLSRDRKSTVKETALFELSRAYQYYGKPEKSIQSIKTFLSDYPKSKRIPNALLIQGKSLQAMSRFADAIRSYRSFLKRFPNHEHSEEVKLHLADAYSSRGSNKKALPIYKQIFKKRNQTSPDLAFKIADAYQKSGHHKKAIAFYKTSLTLDQNRSSKGWIQLQMALSYELLGQIQSSQDLLQKLAKDNNDPVIRELAGQKVNPDP